MHEIAEVVIIGAGVVGASVAHHLAAAGCTDVVLLEAEARQGLGSTGQATGGARAQFADPVDIALSLHSLAEFERFEDETGHPAGYRPTGYLFLATGEDGIAALRATQARQREAGLGDVELLDADEVARAWPWLRTDDVTGAAFRQRDGLLEPLLVLRGYTASAVRRGARLRLGAPARAIRTAGGRVTAVVTDTDEIAARHVVNAAGPWAARVARLTGVEIPVTTLRRELACTGPFDGLPRDLPMTIDTGTGFHCRRDARPHDESGIILAWPDVDAASPGERTPDPAFPARLWERAVHRIPALARTSLDPSRARAGWYEMTPDHRPLVGAVEGTEGLWIAAGFSGHGVMHAPATGRIVAELILRGQTGVADIRGLSPARFAGGNVIEMPESGVL